MFRWPEWLFVRARIDNIPCAELSFEDCLVPDFYVKPLQSQVHGNTAPRSIFLPRNFFCYGVGAHSHQVPALFDISHLTLLIQREWFTVFRYVKPGHHSPWIIKWAAPSPANVCEFRQRFLTHQHTSTRHRVLACLNFFNSFGADTPL
jgi:hypothetical protein